MTRLIRKYLQENRFDDFIEILNGVACGLMFTTFFIYTYFDKFDPKHDDIEFPKALIIAENVLIIYLSVDWLLGLLLSDARVPFIFSAWSLITYLTVLPLAMVNFNIVTDE